MRGYRAVGGIPATSTGTSTFAAELTLPDVRGQARVPLAGSAAPPARGRRAEPAGAHERLAARRAIDCAV